MMNIITKRSRQRSSFFKLVLVFLFLTILLLKRNSESSIHHLETSERDKNYPDKSIILEEKDKTKNIAKVNVEKVLIDHTTHSGIKQTVMITTTSPRRPKRTGVTTDSQDVTLKSNRYTVNNVPLLKNNERMDIEIDDNKIEDKTKHIKNEKIKTTDKNVYGITTNADFVKTTTQRTNYDLDLGNSTTKSNTLAKNKSQNVRSSNNNFKTNIDISANTDSNATEIENNDDDIDKIGNGVANSENDISPTDSDIMTRDGDIDETRRNITNGGNDITMPGNDFERTDNDNGDIRSEIGETNSDITINVKGNSKEYTIGEKNYTDIVKTGDSSAYKKIFFKTKQNDYTQTGISNVTNNSLNKSKNNGKVKANEIDKRATYYLKKIFTNTAQTKGYAKNRVFNIKTRENNGKKDKDNYHNDAKQDTSKPNNKKEKELKSIEDKNKNNYNNKKINSKDVTREKERELIKQKINQLQKRLKKSEEQGKSDKSVKTVSNNKGKIQDKMKQQKPKRSTTYGRDKGSKYITSKYIMHKLLSENGPKLSAKERVKLVTDRCKTFMRENKMKLSKKSKLRFDNKSFMMSQKHNLMICLNSKVASDNLKRVSYALDNNLKGDINDVGRQNARDYSQTRMRGLKQLTSGKAHTSFMLIREPLERLVSAYRDKKAFPENNENSPISFRQYLQNILRGNTDDMNRHHYPYFERCRPCEIKYDFIGLLHNFANDVKKVLVDIGADTKVGIPQREKTGYPLVTSDKLVKQYFSKIPNQMIHELWVKYYKDYYIFGFPYPKHLMN